MAKILICSLGGAIVGGFLLFVVAQVGEAPVVYFPVHKPGTTGMQDVINYQAIVSKFAIIMGVCTGGVVGAIAGSDCDGTKEGAS